MILWLQMLALICSRVCCCENRPVFISNICFGCVFCRRSAAPKLARWLTTLLPDTEFTIGELRTRNRRYDRLVCMALKFRVRCRYVYLDGEAHVRLVLACDGTIVSVSLVWRKEAQ